MHALEQNRVALQPLKFHFDLTKMMDKQGPDL